MTGHGSLQYWPHRRAKSRLPRARNSPTLLEPTLANIVAYKVGMTHVLVVDDSESPSKNMEVARAATILEVPKMEAYGLRLYSIDEVTKYPTTETDIYHKATATKLGLKKVQNDETKLAGFKAKLKEFSDVVVLLAAYPKGMSVQQHHPMRFESPAGGKSIEEKFEYASKLLGTEVKVSDIFKPGEYVDVIGVTKGKGWQGPIKRMHVKRNFHKSTEKIRHGGPLGAFSPGKIYYTTPRAGGLGFNYRTEHNKRIFKIGQKNDVATINRSSGFPNYGNVSNEFILMDGSVPGPAKRLVRLRKSVRHRNEVGIKEPKVSYISK